MKVSIITRENGKPESEFARKLESELQKKRYIRVEVFSETSWIGYNDDFVYTSDLIVSVGGDGTFLRLISKMKLQRPVIGVNFGNVGFLTDLEQSGAIDRICTLVDGGDIPVEKRMRVDLLHNDRIVGTALNDIAFKSTEHSGIVKISVSVDGVVATEFKGDGLLVATPTGSTAYAMSAGGPITDPKMDCFILVPVAPYLLSSRPQIVHGDRKVTISANDGLIFIDGSPVVEYWYPYEGRVFEIRISDQPALFVDVGRNFFEKVNTKLKKHG